MSQRLRLLKVVVQPVFVLDDGESLSERPGQTLTLAPSELDGFPQSLREQVEDFNRQQGDEK